MAKSHQRITKIKRDVIAALLARAEALDVKDGCSIQPAGSDLAPYPDMNNLRIWTRTNLLKGMNKTFITSDAKIVDNTWVQPVLDQDGTAGGSTPAAYANKYHETGAPFKAFDSDTEENKTFWICDNTGTTAQADLTFYTPEPVKVKQYHVLFDGNDIMIDGQVKASNDGSTWYVIGSFTDNNSADLTVECESDDKYKYIQLHSIKRPSSNWVVVWRANIIPVPDKIAEDSLPILTTIIDGLPIYTKISKTTTQGETTKPGLWLSNLIQPYTETLAGSYLRQNFVHTSESQLSDIMAKSLGNYSYSYLQRGIIHRTAGSAHSNDDSYCQHWSPSALGCISHDAIVIPEKLLRSTYTSYQSLVVPTNPDMQRYNETLSKDVEFEFVDNNNNIPLDKTMFNGRVVGDGWTYEFEVVPNHSGSKHNYQPHPESTDLDDSNGGCVTGTLTYTNENGTCTQEVNSCFITTQAFFNPLIEDLPAGTKSIGVKSDVKQYNMTIAPDVCCGYAYCSEEFTSGYYAVRVSDIQNFCSNKEVRTRINDVTTGTLIVGNVSQNAALNSDTYRCGVGKSGYYIGGIQLEYGSGDNWDSTCGGFCGGTAATAQVTMVENTAITEQSGINIYLNIKDLRAEYEAQGLPWTYDCETSRFTITVDFEDKSKTDKYTTTQIIAANIDVNSLGDISSFESKVLKR